MIVLTGKKVRLVLDRNKPNNLEVFLLWTLDFYFKLGITQGDQKNQYQYAKWVQKTLTVCFCLF